MLIKSVIKTGCQRLIVVILHILEEFEKLYIWFITSMLQDIIQLRSYNRLFCYITVKK
jgi:hypothetical protein